MKNLLKLTLAVVFVFGAMSASAQKLGRVDLAAIIPNMTEFKDAQSKLETYGNELSLQLEQMQVEFTTTYSEYEKNMATYSDSIRQMKERELMEMQQRFSDMQQMAQQDIQRKEAELMEPIYNKADEAVRKIAAAGAYTVIFSTTGDQAASAGLAYFDPKQVTDITAEVKKALGITE